MYFNVDESIREYTNRNMEELEEIDPIEEAHRLSHVLPSVLDLEKPKVTQEQSIQAALERLQGGAADYGAPNESYDVPITVRVSKRMAVRIDYFSKRLGIGKADFLREILSDRLTSLSHDMYWNGLLSDVTEKLNDIEFIDRIDEAEHVMEFVHSSK